MERRSPHIVFEESDEKSPEKPSTVHDWGTAEKRVTWLLQNQFQGNRSAMGRATGFSHTAISKVAKGVKPPGRRMLTAIAEKLDVSTDWLLRGLGEPGTNPGAGSSPLRMPVSDELFSERMPDQLRELDGPDDTILVPALRNSSQFWLRLHAGDPILVQPRCGFLPGDLLLLETNPERFPPETRLTDTICAVNCGSSDEPMVKLGSVTFYHASVEDGDTRLEVDTFDPESKDSPLVEDYIVRCHRDGSIESIKRKGRLYSSRGTERFVHSDYDDQLEPDTRRIRYDDIVAVWLGLSFRYPYHSVTQP
jgi:transcriptional regulator with XRE-family HTH domain